MIQLPQLAVLFVSASIFFFNSSAFGLSYGVHLAGRSYVRGMSAEVSAAHESILWGKPQGSGDIYFGLVQFKAAAASHGLLKASASVFPISFLEIRGEQSRTYRYSSPATMSCGDIQCYGPIDRRAIAVRLALGLQNLVGFLSHSAQIVETSDSGEASFDELENLTKVSGQDEGEARAAFAGMKVNDLNQSVIGLAVREFEYKKAKSTNRLIGLAYHTHVTLYEYNLKISSLVGSYKSDYNPESISVALAVEYNWGDEKLSIF